MTDTTHALTLLSFNANHTANNTKSILQNHTHADIIFIQEPWYGNLKRTVSATDPDGVWEFDTQIQPTDWLLLEVQDRTNAQVSAYVHTRWKTSVPQTRHDLIAHPHILCISLLGPNRTNYLFVNVYNYPSTHVALLHLQSLSRPLSPDVILGDFNLHHRIWDSARPTQSAATDLSLLLQEWDLSLMNEPNQPTHFPHDTQLRSSVIDLAWANSDRVAPRATLQVLPALRYGSDHAVLSLTIRAQVDTQPRPILSGKNKAKWEEDISAIIISLHDWPIDTPQSLQQLSTDLFAGIDAVYAKCSHVPNITACFKKWWNIDCTKAHQALRDAVSSSTDIPSARTRFHHTLQVARTVYYDDVIKKACEAKRPWDITLWTKKCPASSTTQVKSSDETVLTTFDALVQGCSDQFFGAVDRVVDPSCVETLPERPKRPHTPFTLNELHECLKGTSNMSALGPDHLGWDSLK